MATGMRIPRYLYVPSPLATSTLVLVGAAAPDIRERLHVGYGSIAAIFVAQTLGAVLGAGLVVLADRRVLRPLPMCLVGALALVGAAAVASVPAIAVAMAVVGLATLGTNARAQGEIMRIAGADRSHAIATFHVFGGLGALATPLAIGALLGVGLSWRATFLVGAGGFLLYAVWARRWGATPREPAPLRLLASGRGRHAITVGGLGQGVQTTVPLWLAQLLHDGFGASPARAGAAVSCFTAAVLASRLVARRLAARVDLGRLAAAFAAVCAGGGVLLAVAPDAPLAALAALLMGGGIGPMIPLSVARAGELGIDGQSAAATTIGLGGATQLVLPVVVGLLAAGVGLQLALGALVVPALLVVLAARRS